MTNPTTRRIVQRTEGEHGLHAWTDWKEMSDGKIRCFVAAAYNGEPLYVGSSYECYVWLAGYAHAMTRVAERVSISESAESCTES